MNVAKKSLKKLNTLKILSINKSLRIALIIISSVLILSMIYMLFITYNYQKYTKEKYPVYSYVDKAKVNYSVFLIPNEIIAEKSLNEGSTYITSLVDYIDTDLKYVFIGDGPGDIQGKYNVTAVLEGYIPDEKGAISLWKKSYIILPDTSFTGNKEISVEKEIPINIKAYNDFLKTVAKTIDFSFYSKLTITWNILAEVKTDKGMIKEALEPTMEVPLSTKYFNISGKLTDGKKSAIEDTKVIISPLFKRKITVYWSAAGICALSLIFLLLFTASYTVTDPFEKKLRHIFKEHGIRMAALNSEIPDTNKSVIEVESIDDLVKIADEIGKPILYKNSKNVQDINRLFVDDDSTLYMLDLKKGITQGLTKIKENHNSIDV